MNFLGQGIQELPEYYRQTDRQTDKCNWEHHYATFAGGKNTCVYLLIYC